MSILVGFGYFQNYYRQVWYESIFNSPYLWGLLALILLYIILRKTKKDYHSHWNQLIDDFQYSSKDFYALVKEEMLSNGISGISTSFINLNKNTIVSGRRLYLEVSWQGYVYYICACPFGNGFFISWWLLKKTSIIQLILLKIPKIGGWLVRNLYPSTFYKLDTASMFMSYAQSSVLKIVDDITKDSGTKLSESERKPVLKDIFKR